LKESSSPNEANALTPGHFLIGGPITALPNIDFTTIPLNRLKYWELVQRKVQDFWKIWSRDYLHTLQLRSKWKVVKCDFKVNDVVLVIDEQTPPTHWPLGIITDVHPGKDGLVRAVTVRMRIADFDSIKDLQHAQLPRMDEFKRPIIKLVYLPICEE